MSNQYIYPTEKFNVKLDLEIEVKFVGVWDGISVEVISKRYQEMLTNGEFDKILKEKIIEDLEGEPFDCNDPEPFDRLCFVVKERNEVLNEN